jgi:hypothetical protein
MVGCVVEAGSYTTSSKKARLGAARRWLPGFVDTEVIILSCALNHRTGFWFVEFDGGADGGQAAAFQRKMNFATIPACSSTFEKFAMKDSEREKLKFL